MILTIFLSLLLLLITTVFIYWIIWSDVEFWGKISDNMLDCIFSIAIRQEQVDLFEVEDSELLLEVDRVILIEITILWHTIYIDIHK